MSYNNKIKIEKCLFINNSQLVSISEDLIDKIWVNKK